LNIVDFQEGSVAKQAGLKAGDAIISVDGSAVGTVEDLKLLLFYKKKSDTLLVKVMRKRFLLGDKEMEFIVKL
jgi:S1-C subfamily serine protease